MAGQFYRRRKYGASSVTTVFVGMAFDDVLVSSTVMDCAFGVSVLVWAAVVMCCVGAARAVVCFALAVVRLFV